MTTRLTLLLFAGLLALPARAQHPASDPETSYRAAYQFIARERWEDALGAMRAFVQAFPQSRQADAAAFWGCFSLERLPARRAESDTCFADFARRYPQSAWRDDAEARRLQGAARRVQESSQRSGAATGWAPSPPAAPGITYSYQAALAELQGTLASDRGHTFTTTSGNRVRQESTIEVLAIQALAQRGNDAAVDDLRRLALESESVSVREAAIGGLARIGTERSQGVLIELVGNLLERAAQRDTVASQVAVGALQQAARNGTNLLLPFAERYYKNDRLARDLRWTLLMTLRVSGTPEAQALLWRVAQDGQMEPRQRSEALQWLAPSFTAEDLARLAALLRRETDVQVREAYVRALGHVVGGIPRFSSTTWNSGAIHYTDADGIWRVADGAPVSPVDPAQAEAVVAQARARTLAQAREDVTARQARREALAEQALQVLAEQLRTEQEPRVQRAIVQSLSAPGYDTGTEALARFAQSTGAEDTVRDDAIEGLARIGTEAAFAALRGLLGHLTAPRLLTKDIQALVYSPAFRVREEAIPDLVRLTGHPELSVRRAAVDALGRLEAPQARQALLDLIRGGR